MKVAIVHDYIKEYGGAERVLEALHDMYPRATVFTSVYLPSYLGPHEERFKDWNIKTSFLQYVPLKHKLISIFRVFSPLAFRSFDFSGYDIIISSATGAYFPNSLNKKKAKLVCYCHTPPRYLYGYATAREWRKNTILNILGVILNHFLRMMDFSFSKNVDFYIANSKEVAGRIMKFYRRESEVVYPPVDTENSDWQFSDKRRDGEFKEYFLAGGRLARPKHIDLIVRAFIKLNLKLKVFGKPFAGYGEELSGIAKGHENIEFLGEVDDQEKFELLKCAKAFINASEDEDFGILPVESMASGTPVIAYRSGGVKETVIDEQTGVFFDELLDTSLVNAVKSFNKLKFSHEICRKRAADFSKGVFVEKLKNFINSIKYA